MDARMGYHVAAAEGTLAPTYTESLQEYYFLRSVSGFRRNYYSHRFHANSKPTGRALSVVTTNAPESPEALKLPPVMMT